MKVAITLLPLILVFFLSNCGEVESVWDSLDSAIFDNSVTLTEEEKAKLTKDMIEKVNKKIKENTLDKVEKIVDSQGDYNECMAEKKFAKTVCLRSHEGRIEKIISVVVK